MSPLHSGAFGGSKNGEATLAGLQVEEATEVTPELVDAFARLIPQLSRSSPPPTEHEVAELVDAPGTHVLVARLASDGETVGDIVGTLTLVLFRIPTGIRAWIEDVVVDDAARGRGAGEALTALALDIAGASGAKTVELTSRPSREPANRLYQRLGFEARETNVYRYTL
ncbi:MAG TPA: GNAT family N-acetyltransferase [Acidimicrobiales bacterium]|nr:GNAT family N-acetyltransferase [Acidimicrobiales bacterium]